MLIGTAGESGSAYEPYFLPLKNLFVYLKVSEILFYKPRHELTVAGCGGTLADERFANSVGEAQYSFSLLSTLRFKPQILSSDPGCGSLVYLVVNWYHFGRIIKMHTNSQKLGPTKSRPLWEI